MKWDNMLVTINLCCCEKWTMKHDIICVAGFVGLPIPQRFVMCLTDD